MLTIQNKCTFCNNSVARKPQFHAFLTRYFTNIYFSMPSYQCIYLTEFAMYVTPVTRKISIGARAAIMVLHASHCSPLRCMTCSSTPAPWRADARFLHKQCFHWRVTVPFRGNQSEDRLLMDTWRKTVEHVASSLCAEVGVIARQRRPSEYITVFGLRFGCLDRKFRREAYDSILNGEVDC